MSKRLQVLLEEAELREIRRAARKERLTVADWVRRAIRAARQLPPRREAGEKLEAVRRAAAHAFPTGPIEQLLAEIERGYLPPDAPRRP
jgi:hypothetical protein